MLLDWERPYFFLQRRKISVHSAKRIRIGRKLTSEFPIRRREKSTTRKMEKRHTKTSATSPAIAITNLVIG